MPHEKCNQWRFPECATEDMMIIAAVCASPVATVFE